MSRRTKENSIVNPFRSPNWEPMPSEPGVTVLSIAGTFSEGAMDSPFAGVVYRQDATGKIFGNMIDRNGPSQFIGRQTIGRLTFIKRYDRFLAERNVFQDNQALTLLVETSANNNPIYYSFTRNEEGVWLGRYRTEGSERRTEAHCRLAQIETPATLFTFVHDDPYSRSEYDRVVEDFRQRAERERATRKPQTIFRAGSQLSPGRYN